MGSFSPLAWVMAIRDEEMAKLRRERMESDKRIANAIFHKEEMATSIRRLEAIITERDGELEALNQSSQQQQLRIDALEGQNKIQEDEIKSLVKWLDREMGLKEKHLAMHERARYLAMNSLQPPEPDEYDDQLS